MVLQVEDLTKIFYKKEEFIAVDKLNFRVNKGDIVGLLGSNGAGKTTTIKMLCGLLLSDYGSVNIFGLDIKDRTTLKEILRRSSFLLEGQRNIYYNLSLLENIKYFLALKGIAYREKKKNVEELIDFFDLKGEEKNPIFSFSTGMKQKASIILALAGNEEFIVLDEPTLGLDIHSAKNMVEILKDYVIKHKKTVLITAHDMNVIESLCDRALLMERGKIIKDDYITNLKHLFNINKIKITCKNIEKHYLSELENSYKINWNANVDETYSLDFNLESFKMGKLILELEDKNIKILSIKSDNSDFGSSYIKLVDNYKYEEGLVL